MGLQADIKASRDRDIWQWDEYAEKYNLLVSSEADMEYAVEAARRLRKAGDAMPGWMYDALGLEELIEALENVTMEGDA